MRVILIEDAKKLGKKGEIVNVAEGYARNYLIPKGVVVEATEANLRNLSHQQAVKQDRVRKEEQEARELAERLSALTVVIRAKTGEAGRLFGSVTAQDIAEAITTATGVELDKRRVELDEPLKALGDYEIAVKLYQGVTAKVTVKVTAE